MKIFLAHELLAEYPLPPDGTRNQRFSPPGQPQPRFQPANRKQSSRQEEQRLRAMDSSVADYLDFARSEPGVTQRHRFLRQLYALSRQVTRDIFVQTIQRAHRYRIVDLSTLRRIAWFCISQQDEMLPEVDVDDDFQQRPAYQEGCLTEEPDLTVYDQRCEENNEEHQEEKEDDDGNRPF